jgi:hypothetical protein
LDAETLFCRHCGFAGGQRPGRGRKFDFSIFASFLNRLMILATILLLLFLVHLTGAFTAARDWYMEVSADKTVNTLCARCNGSGRTACTSCGGKGRLVKPVESKCLNCEGSGVHKFRLSSTKSVCPFCKGKGTIAKEESASCAVCAQTGSIACPPCGGTGRPPRQTLVEKIKAGLGW